jgi:UDP-N-acetylmuramoylalanine--D-glutamate ligase
MEAYTAIKARIFQFQPKDGVTILNREDSGAWSLRTQVPGRVISFGLNEPPGEYVGTFLRDGVFYIRMNSHTIALCPENLVRLRGRHNTLNILAACALAVAAGFSPAAIQTGVEGFTGIPHRLEFVRSWRGADWYNDSIATTPERAIAAIKSFDEPLVLLSGGRDKKLPWEEFAELVHKRVDHLVVFGEAAEIIVKSLGEARPGKRPYTLVRCKGLQEAVEAAAQVAEAGDVVLMAPGGTSFDEFKDFEMRGERFRKWVRELS